MSWKLKQNGHSPISCNTDQTLLKKKKKTGVTVSSASVRLHLDSLFEHRSLSTSSSWTKSHFPRNIRHRHRLCLWQQSPHVDDQTKKGGMKEKSSQRQLRTLHSYERIPKATDAESCTNCIYNSALGKTLQQKYEEWCLDTDKDLDYLDKDLRNMKATKIRKLEKVRRRDRLARHTVSSIGMR